MLFGFVQQVINAEGVQKDVIAASESLQKQEINHKSIFNGANIMEWSIFINEFVIPSKKYTKEPKIHKALESRPIAIKFQRPKWIPQHSTSTIENDGYGSKKIVSRPNDRWIR